MCAKKNKPPRGLTITLDELHERWTGFQKKYPTDEDCIEEILIMGNFDARVCSRCGSVEKSRDLGSPHARCMECNKEIYLFKGTFFERMRKPKAYLAALWLRSEQIGISSNRLARLVHIAQSTAFEIEKKIDKVIFEVMMEDAATVYSGHFRAIMTKRSHETPARQHAVAEQDLVDAQQRANSQSAQDVPGSNRDPSTQNEGNESLFDDSVTEQNMEQSMETNSPTCEPGAARNSGKSETPQAERLQEPQELRDLLLNTLSDTDAFHVDDLVEMLDVPVGLVLSALLDLQLEKKVIDVGAMRYKKTKKDLDLLGLAKFFDIDEKALEKFFNQVEHVFHGVSRKNLQFYLAWFWSLVGAVFKEPANLIRACASSKHLSRHDVRDFVTEPTVKVLFA